MAKRFIPGGSELLEHEGLTTTIAQWEDGQRAAVTRGFFEWWYFDAHFDDGSTAVIVFLTKPLVEYNGPLKPGLEFTLTRSDGSRLPSRRLYPADQFRAAQDRCDVKLGPSWACGDLHRYEVHAENDSMAADLVFTGEVPAWRSGNGKTYYDDSYERYSGWMPAIPFGYVEGTLTYDGQTRRVRGTGYHDHNWGNIGLNEILSHWYWGRAHVGDFSTIFVEMNGPKAYGRYRYPVFMLAKGDRILIGDGAPLRLDIGDVVPHASGRSFPRRLDFHWESDGGHVQLALREPRIIEATSLLAFLPKWQQRFVRLVANPYYFRFMSQLTLEVDLPGVRATEQGEALFEIMLLR